jgi:hypothetical protein
MTVRASIGSTVRWFGLAALLATAPVMVPVMGQAATLTLQPQVSGNVFGTNGHANVRITDTLQGVNNLHVAAGGFAVTTADRTLSFTAWCLDIVTNLRLPSQYQVTTTPFSGRVLDARQTGNIERLFETAFKTLNLGNGTQSAGFQLALWEIVNEVTTRAFSLSDGNFTATNSNAAIAFGQGLLNGLRTPISQSYELTYYASNDSRAPANRNGHYSQNLVSASPVPLPAAGWLMLAALGGIAVLRRRKTV